MSILLTIIRIHDKFLAALKKTELSVNMAVRLNETTGRSQYECPVNHFLESWDDAEIIPGQLSLSQPCINPIFDTRSFQDSLLKWSDKDMEFHDYLKESWERNYFHFSGYFDFEKFWIKSLRNGVFTYDNTSYLRILSKRGFVRILETTITPSDREFEVILTESVSIGTGMHSNNPWLMELPDPISRQCWDNVAAISGIDAENLNLKTGSLIKDCQKVLFFLLLFNRVRPRALSQWLLVLVTLTPAMSVIMPESILPLHQDIKGNRLYYFEYG